MEESSPIGFKVVLILYLLYCDSKFSVFFPAASSPCFCWALSECLAPFLVMLGEDGGWNCSILVSSEDFYCELLKLLKLKMKSRISLFLSESIIEFDSVPLNFDF